MNTSRIEIYNNSDEKPTVIQPPAGYEFTGDFSPLPHMRYPHYGFEVRPLPTAKEQRESKLHKVLADAANRYTYRQTIEQIEAIFAEYPDRKESL